MIKPNLPDKLIKTCILSCDVSLGCQLSLNNLGIKTISIEGSMNCDNAIKNHADIYITHYNDEKLFISRNNCSINGEEIIKYISVNTTYSDGVITYPYDVFMNSVIFGRRLICNINHVHPDIKHLAMSDGYDIINVKQGYTKCNICIVDEKSVITEDVGIYNALNRFGFDVLLLEHKVVRLNGYNHGFIGGASGKIDADKLAFFGDITIHPEYDRIQRFLYDRGIMDVSLSKEYLTDYGSLIPIE